MWVNLKARCHKRGGWAEWSVAPQSELSTHQSNPQPQTPAHPLNHPPTRPLVTHPPAPWRPTHPLSTHRVCGLAHRLQQRVVARVEGHGEGAVHDAPMDLCAKVCGGRRGGERGRVEDYSKTRKSALSWLRIQSSQAGRGARECERTRDGLGRRHAVRAQDCKPAALTPRHPDTFIPSLAAGRGCKRRAAQASRNPSRQVPTAAAACPAAPPPRSATSVHSARSAHGAHPAS